MMLELSVAAVSCALAVLGAVHAFKTRPARAAWLLLASAVCFGYLLPLVEINLMGLYRFDGKLTVLNIPVHLGVAWFGLYYLALTLAETILGGADAAGKHPLLLPLLCGLILGVLEIQWDPTLLAAGLMRFDVPGFASYRWNFSPGFPITHAYFGFAYAFLYVHWRDARAPVCLVSLLGGFSLAVFPLAGMQVVPLMTPVYQAAGELLDRPALIMLDVILCAVGFSGLAAGFGLWVKFARRRVFAS